MACNVKNCGLVINGQLFLQAIDSYFNFHLNGITASAADGESPSSGPDGEFAKLLGRNYLQTFFAYH